MQEGLVEGMSLGWGFANLPRQNLPQVSKQTLIGIVVAISGNVLISFALNLQKLAHKRTQQQRRLDAMNGAPKQEPHNANGALHEENEESHEAHGHQEGREPDSRSSTTATAALVETQPLIVQPSIHARDYGSATPNPTGEAFAPPPVAQAKPRRTLLSRIIPFKPKNKQGGSTRTTLPIDIVTEEAAMHGLSHHNKKDRAVDDSPVEQNEGAYLKSKTWYVSSQTLCFEGLLIGSQVARVPAHERRGTWKLYLLCLRARLSSRTTWDSEYLRLPHHLMLFNWETISSPSSPTASSHL
jgi:hypothetical protein